jgi:glyoxylase-like metal-dependent hydrolase (beta-lactamase superfamily II)
MKRLHRPDLYGWSLFDEDRDIDFHSVIWVRPEGNVLVDPLPLSDHDQAHLEQLGGAAWIVVTNSDHVRDAANLAVGTGAEVIGPKEEADSFPLKCNRWLADGDQVVPGLKVLELHGSKTPGELALLLEGSTLITGDLIRAHQGGKLCLLPDRKLTDRQKAIASVRRLTKLADLETVLPGDGWPVFRNAREALSELLESLRE